jgi:hypothetical protein
MLIVVLRLTEFRLGYSNTLPQKNLGLKKEYFDLAKRGRFRYRVFQELGQMGLVHHYLLMLHFQRYRLHLLPL